MSYYKVKVKSKIENDKGKIQKVTEEHLLWAVSVGDAETQVHKEYEHVGFDWELVSVTESKVVKVLSVE